LPCIVASIFVLPSLTRADGPLDDARKSKLKGSVKAFFEAVAKHDYEAASKDFDEAVRKASPPEKLKELFETLDKQLGALKSRGEPRLEKVGKYEVVVVPCQFEKMKLDARISFDAEGRIAGYGFVPAASTEYKAPDYVKRDAFREIEVKINEGTAWELPGTLSVPAGRGPFSAVVLVHGSGPNDRDETILGNKPFRDLAWGLSSRGIAVLRYDKRTRVHGSKMIGQDFPTLKEEVTDDALAAVALLRKTNDVDPQRVFVLGHSLGGYVASRIGEADPQIAGLIVMAGNSRPLEDLVVEQLTYIYSLEGPTDKQKEELEQLKKKAARVKESDLAAETPGKELPLGVPGKYWLSIRAIQPVETAAKLAMPMLVLQGERDYQVTMADFALWRTGLGTKKNASLKSYPKLNHLFIEGEGKSKPAEYLKAGHVAGEVIDGIAAWIRETPAAERGARDSWHADRGRVTLVVSPAGSEGVESGGCRCRRRLLPFSIRHSRGARPCRPVR
jgi:alpha-beta hydrolase superfamily lysophospholipase